MRSKRRKLQRHGMAGTLQKVAQRMYTHFCSIRHSAAPDYRGPTPSEYEEIDRCFAEAGLSLNTLIVSPPEFQAFRQTFRFDDDYHGGKEGAVWYEKLLEHYLAYKLCDLDRVRRHGGVYVDVAACGSPWARILRSKGFEAYAVDLHVQPEFRHLDYYLEADATTMPFTDSSVGAMSLQCAFEMFSADSDMRFIAECRRVLRPGGCVVLVPLYMHTHYCGYSTPEYYGKQREAGAALYIRRKRSGIPFSRKYSVQELKRRVLSRVVECDLRFQLYKLSNPNDLGPGIYCRYLMRILRGVS